MSEQLLVAPIKSQYSDVYPIKAIFFGVDLKLAQDLWGLLILLARIFVNLACNFLYFAPIVLNFL